MWKKAVFGSVLAGFLGVVLWVSCLSSLPHDIEWDVATRVTNVLDRTGFDHVIPVVDGRDVELRGMVPTARDAARAERIVAMVRGVRVVDADLEVGPPGDVGGGDS